MAAEAEMCKVYEVAGARLDNVVVVVADILMRRHLECLIGLDFLDARVTQPQSSRLRKEGMWWGVRIGSGAGRVKTARHMKL